MGIPRFPVRGLLKAKAELALSITDYNLKRLITIKETPACSSSVPDQREASPLLSTPTPRRRFCTACYTEAFNMSVLNLRPCYCLVRLGAGMRRKRRYKNDLCTERPSVKAITTS